MDAKDILLGLPKTTTAAAAAAAVKGGGGGDNNNINNNNKKKSSSSSSSKPLLHNKDSSSSHHHHHHRKPDGVSREVYALTGGLAMPSMMPSSSVDLHHRHRATSSTPATNNLPQKVLPLLYYLPRSSSSSSSSLSLHITTTTTTFLTSSSPRHKQQPPHHLILPMAAQTNTNNTPSPPPDHCSYLPDANFYKIEAILRPWRVPQVSSALLKMGIRGVTVSDVRGFGAQGGLTERQAGSEYSEDKFLAKVKMEIVVSKEQVEAVIDKIIEEARTGEIGDGKIFLLPVTDVIRVRTGERGENAERMLGGRSDMSSSV